MRLLILLISLFFGVCAWGKQNTSDCAKAYGPYFLNTYVEELIVEMSKDTRDKIAETSEKDLYKFHHGLGTAIRNKWLWGKRSSSLLLYFKCQGVDHPDDMSSRIIYALWVELNKNKSPEEKKNIENKRKAVADKRATYSVIMKECEDILMKNQEGLQACIRKFGNPSSNKINDDPFYSLIVARDGSVKKVDHFKGGSENVKPCIEEIVRKFKFSTFKTDEEIDLYITQFPRCRTNLLNNL